MKKELGEAPLPIGGWLILVAVQLMVILNLPVTALEIMIINLPNSNGLDIGYTVISILLGLVCSLFPVYCILLFFQRKKLFVPSFILLLVLYLLLQAGQYVSNVMNSNGFFFDFRGIFTIGLCISIIIYMFCSRRVKKTFVFGAKEKAHRDDTPPLQIYGWLIVIAFDIAVRLYRQFSDCVMVVDRLFTLELKSYSALSFVFYFATLALAIYTVLLFYRRKKLFKISYILLLAALLIPYANDLIRTGITDYISAMYDAAYFVAATLYLRFSRRVKNTFVYEGFAPADSTERKDVNP